MIFPYATVPSCSQLICPGWLLIFRDSLHLRKRNQLVLSGDRCMRDPGRTTLRDKGHEVRLWIACDAKTKVIAEMQLGPHTSLMVTTIGM